MFVAKTPIIYKNFPGIIDVPGDKYAITFCPTFVHKPGKSFTFQTQSVREKDFVVLSNTTISSLDKVCENAVNQQLSSTIQEELAEIWELFISDEKTANENLSLKSIMELSNSAQDIDNIWAFYKCLTESIYFEKKSELLFAIRTEQQIEQIKLQTQAKEQEIVQRQEFIERLKNKKLNLPDDKKFMYEVEALAMCKTDKSRVLKDAGLKETAEFAHKILLDTGIWNIAKNPYPARYGLSMTGNNENFPEPNDEGRVEIKTMSFAIDSKWSNDPDDAIAFDGQYLWVHVADPASVILPDSPADIVARTRGSTLYLPDDQIRMLSQKSLDDYALGLKQGLSRALSFKIKLSDNNSIENVEVLKTFVPVTRLTYDEADNQQNSEQMAPLYEIAHKNIAKRQEAGAIFIEMPEVHIRVEQNGSDIPTVVIEQEKRSFASSVVRECMLIAGEAAARYAYTNEIPFPYISQSAPVLPNEIPEGLAGNYKIRRNMKSRTVGVTPTAHAGLGLAMYCQVTSPLRRYTDFIAHQQLHAFLAGRMLIDKDTLLQKISMSDLNANSCNKAERASNLHWICVYLIQHPQWAGEATVVDFKNNMAVVIISSLALETTINLGPNAKVNDTVVLTVKNVNITELVITFKIQESQK